MLLVVRILPELSQHQPLARRSPGIRRREQHAPAEGVPFGLTDGAAVLDDPLPRAARAGAQAEDREVVEHHEAIFSDREFAAAAVCSARRLPASRQSVFSGAPRWTIGGSIDFKSALKLSATPASRTCASRRPERRPLTQRVPGSNPSAPTEPSRTMAEPLGSVLRQPFLPSARPTKVRRVFRSRRGGAVPVSWCGTDRRVRREL
jgi:hypothetical protein